MLDPYASILLNSLIYTDYLDHAIEQGKIGLSLDGEPLDKAYLRFYMAQGYKSKEQINEGVGGCE